MNHKRFCKALSLKDDPQLIEDYRRIHAPGAGWPEISKGMQEVGIIAMEIYLLRNNLFMIMDTIADFDHDRAMCELASKPRQSEWEDYVSRFQQTSADSTAAEKWQLMECIYKMEDL